MYLGKTAVNTYDKGIGREFLVSNGQGSYGFSTVVGANTRREHGLLVTREKGEPHHTVLVSKVEETIVAGNKKYQLSTNKYKDLVYPDGYRYLQEYQGTPVPKMLFVIHSVFLEKSIFMPHGGNCTVLKYKLLSSPQKINIEIRPLVAHRAKDYIPQPDVRPSFVTTSSDRTVKVSGRGYDSHILFSHGEWREKNLWYENLVYENDHKREAPELDFLWSPGFNAVEMEEGDVIYIVLGETPVHYSVAQLETLERETLGRLRSFVESAHVPVTHTTIQDMIHASYHLVDNRAAESPTIYSGYPSVSIKSRETFISLPGLMLATGREKEASQVIDYWVAQAKMMNNVVPGIIDYTGTPVLEGADVGLWLFYALQKYTAHVKTNEKINELWVDLKSIIHKYIEGIDAFKLEMDESLGLLNLLGSNSHRHWMAGSAEGEPIVLRRGYLVELNALWFNALRFMEEAACAQGDEKAKDQYASIAKKVQDNFEKVFLVPGKRHLYDWVDFKSNEKDDSIRPNMILATSLPFSPLSATTMKNVFNVCWDELYTTYGLRTLSPSHEKFKGRAEGRVDQKMKAKYRGMAWPWLLGHFITAYMRLHPAPDAVDMALTFVRPFHSHARYGCLGGVAEFFDGFMPYNPSGDVLSATALGEVLRVLQEDIGNRS